MVDHVEVPAVDQITLVLRDGRDRAVGERGRLRRQGRGARRAARSTARRSVYDVSVPGPAHHPLTTRCDRAANFAPDDASRAACRRRVARVRAAYCRRHGEVDITITLSVEG